MYSIRHVAASLLLLFICASLCEGSPRAALVYGGQRHLSGWQFGSERGLDRNVAEENIRRAGIPYDFHSFSDLPEKGLDKENYPLSIIYLAQRSSEQEAAAVKSYLESGGRAIIVIPSDGLDRGPGDELLEMFSCRIGRRYTRDFYPNVTTRGRPPRIWGRFRRIIFTEPDGFPQFIENLPFTLYDIKPISDELDVIAYWEDLQEEVEIPAVIRHEYGYIFNLNSWGDLYNFRTFIANAAVGLVPELAEQVYDNLAGIYRDTLAQTSSASIAGEGAGFLERACRYKEIASAAAGRGDFKAANRLVLRADANLVNAYAASMESNPDETRLIGIARHSNTHPDDTLSRYKRAGFNAVTLWGSGGPASLEDWFDAARRHDVSIGAMVSPFYLRPYGYSSEADYYQAVLKKAREEDWRNVFPRDYGRERLVPERLSGHLCPTRMRDFGIENTLKYIRKLSELKHLAGLDHIFLDHIRGHHRSFCVCDYCREKFQQDTGIEAHNWPADVIVRYSDEYARWRASIVTSVVREVSLGASSMVPGIKVGIFQRRVSDARREGQYWWEWGDYVDYIMPMIYKHEINIVRERLEEIDNLLPAGKRAKPLPVLAVPGYRVRDYLTWMKLIEVQKELAPAGIRFYTDNMMSEPIIELLSAGPFREKL